MFLLMQILFSLAESNKIVLCSSSLIFAIVRFILSKSLSKEKVFEAMNMLKILVHILPVYERTIHSALFSDFKDFEDAVQYFTAFDHKIPIFITRNIKDYKHAKIPIFAPKEYLTMYFENTNY